MQVSVIMQVVVVAPFQNKNTVHRDLPSEITRTSCIGRGIELLQFATTQFSCIPL